ILAVLLLGGCGKAAEQKPGAAKVHPPAAASSPPLAPAFGITEDDANVLWSPEASHQPGTAFRSAQQQLTALKPTYLRVLIDWAALQPTSGQPPQLSQPTDGCDRQADPC